MQLIFIKFDPVTINRMEKFSAVKLAYNLRYMHRKN
jgi:hypothetical protein